MTGAVAFGAPLRSSSSPTGAPPNASSIRLLAGRLLEQPELAQLLRKQAGTHRTPAKGTPGPRVVLLGEHALESTVAHNLVGTVEAFQFQARGSGTAASINVFLAAGDRATALFAGVYSSRDGRPHSLLTSGFLRAPGLRHGTRSPSAPPVCNPAGRTGLPCSGKVAQSTSATEPADYATARGHPNAGCARCPALGPPARAHAPALSPPTSNAPFTAALLAAARMSLAQTLRAGRGLRP